MTTLTIRNLSSTPLTLILVERYKSPEHLHLNDIHGTTSSKWLLPWFSNTTTPQPPPTSKAIASNNETYTTTSHYLHIPPFKRLTTAISSPASVTGEKVRLTFEVDDQRYRIELPSSSPRSQTLTPLSSSPPTHEFTAVYLPQSSHLSLHSSTTLSSWMSHLSDSTPLSALSIPGTHNSPCYYKALPSVRCQAVSPLLQLQNGIRFFDIRVQPESPTSSRLVLVHAVFPISLTGGKTFASLLERIYSFLDANPSETLIMSVKREGIGNMSDQQVARILHDHYTSQPSHAHRWYTSPKIPTLGQVRGKIVLMRRLVLDDKLRSINSGQGWAIDAECWADNTSCDYHGDVCVQDFYEVETVANIEKKLNHCTEQLKRAASVVASLPGVTCDAIHPTPTQPFFVNFLTASNFFRRDVWPERVAQVVGPRVLGWLCEWHARGDDQAGVDGERVESEVEGGKEQEAEGGGEKLFVGDGGCGIVVMDWVGLQDDWDLVRVVVGWNAKLMMREIEVVGVEEAG